MWASSHRRRVGFLCLEVGGGAKPKEEPEGRGTGMGHPPEQKGRERNASLALGAAVGLHSWVNPEPMSWHRCAGAGSIAGSQSASGTKNAPAVSSSSACHLVA